MATGNDVTVGGATAPLDTGNPALGTHDSAGVIRRDPPPTNASGNPRTFYPYSIPAWNPPPGTSKPVAADLSKLKPATAAVRTTVIKQPASKLKFTAD